MGRSEELDLEELKFICHQMMLGRTDAQIIGDLAEEWGGRDKRTIRSIRRTFEATQEVILAHMDKMKSLNDGPPQTNTDMFIDDYNNTAKGLRPVKDKSGNLKYEPWLET